jgi:hypothetical protein
MEGTLSYSARHKRLGQDRHAGKHSHANRKHSHANRRHSWASQRKNRAETNPVEMPADPGPRARQPFVSAEE